MPPKVSLLPPSGPPIASLLAELWLVSNSLISLILSSIGPAILGREAKFLPALREAAGPRPWLLDRARKPSPRKERSRRGKSLRPEPGNRSPRLFRLWWRPCPYRGGHGCAAYGRNTSPSWATIVPGRAIAALNQPPPGLPGLACCAARSKVAQPGGVTLAQAAALGRQN
jgi:hypothetical protein